MSEETKVRQKPGPKPKSKEDTTPVGREVAAHSPRGRERIPMGVGYNISYPEHKKDPNFFYYFVADQGGNVDRRIDAGFDFVIEDGKKYIRRGKDGIDMICMRQPMKYRLEDLELKRDESSTIVKAQQVLEEGQHIPADRKQALQKDSELDPMQP